MFSRPCFSLAACMLCIIPVAFAQPQLPEGPGKAVIEQACLGCHEPVRILNAGYNRQDWQNIVHMMLRKGYAYASTAVSFRFAVAGTVAAAVRLSVAPLQRPENDACSTAAVG